MSYSYVKRYIFNFVPCKIKFGTEEKTFIQATYEVYNVLNKKKLNKKKKNFT